MSEKVVTPSREAEIAALTERLHTALTAEGERSRRMTVDYHDGYRKFVLIDEADVQAILPLLADLQQARQEADAERRLRGMDAAKRLDAEAALQQAHEALEEMQRIRLAACYDSAAAKMLAMCNALDAALKAGR